MTDGGNRPSLLLIHGQPGSGGDWALVENLLGHRYKILAPTRPGWGDNPLQPMGLAGNAAWLIDLIEASYEFSPPFLVVGHSLGGGIAAEMALQRPDLVSALVLVGSVGTQSALSGLDKLLAMPKLSNTMMISGAAAVRAGRRATNRMKGVAVAGRVADRVSATPTARGLAFLDEQPINERGRQSFIAEQKALLAETPTLQQRLGGIRVPTLVVHGTQDRIVPRLATVELAELIPGAEWVSLEGAGHMVPMDEPGLISQLIDRYARLVF